MSNAHLFEDCGPPVYTFTKRCPICLRSFGRSFGPEDEIGPVMLEVATEYNLHTCAPPSRVPSRPRDGSADGGEP